MSTIYGNPLLIGGGGVKLNIDYGKNPPSDTTKLWVPRTTTPSSVEAKYEFKFGNEQLAVSDTNFIPHTSTDAGSMRGIPVGNYIYIFKSSSSYSGFQRYDMTKNEWDTSFTSAVYPKNALNYVSTVAINDKIYCLGGYSSGAQSYVYEYDIAQNTFTAKTNSPINLSAGCWIKYGDVLYGFGTYYGSYNRVVKYDYTTNTFTDVSSEFSFGSSQTTYGSNVYYYPFDAGNGIYYLLPTHYNTVTVSSTDLIKVDMANKSVTKDISLSTLCPTINYPLPTSGTTLYKDFCFAEAGIVQVGSTGYIIGGKAANNRDVPFIWKVNISSGGLTATVLDKYLFDPTKSLNLAQRRAAACLNNEIHIIQYCYSGSDTTYRNNQTLTLYSPLDNNKLFLQTGFGNNKFNIINDNKAKVEIAINNAFIGNSENKADETNAYLYSTADSKWKNIKTGEILKPLNEYTWAEIRQISDANKAIEYGFKPGDTKTITINGTIGNTTITNQTVEAVVIGINHNAEKEGNNRIHFLIGKSGSNLCGMTDSQYSGDGITTPGWCCMNTSTTNVGGWNNSYMRKTFLGNTGTPTSPAANTFLSALPADLRAEMKSCIKYSDNTGAGPNSASEVTATTDYLFLLSEFEVFGTRTYANTSEQNSQAQYDYFKAANSRIAGSWASPETAVNWWIRSASDGGDLYFCDVMFNGILDGTGLANASMGVLPGFCI